MAFYARIENELVMEIIDSEEKPEFHPDIEIVEVNAQTREGWVRSGGLIVDPETIKTVQQVKDQKIAQVSQLREQKYREGMNYAVGATSYNFQVDLEAQKDMTAIMLQFALGNTNPHGGAWRDSDNTAVSMNDTAVQAFIQAAFSYVLGIKQSAWAHKENLKTLNAKQDVIDYNIENNWPDNS